MQLKNEVLPLLIAKVGLNYSFSVEQLNKLETLAARYSRAMTTEIFVERMKIINPNIFIKGDYVNDRTKIESVCNICGNTWSPMAGSLLAGHGCPKCKAQRISSLRTLSTEEYIEKLKSVNPNIELLEQYKGTHTKIRVRCFVCNYEWMPEPSSLLAGYGCPKCGKNARLTQEEFIKRVKELSPTIMITGKYVNSKSRVQCVCQTCGNKWEPIASSLLRGSGCQVCSREKRKKNKENDV